MSTPDPNPATNATGANMDLDSRIAEPTHGSEPPKSAWERIGFKNALEEAQQRAEAAVEDLTPATGLPEKQEASRSHSGKKAHSRSLSSRVMGIFRSSGDAEVKEEVSEKK